MRMLSILLKIASATLPREHRQRWREEALAVLLAVRGLRRWRYAFDTVLKAPLLTWQHRRAAHPDAPALWVAVLAGLGLLCVPVLALGSVTVGPFLGPDGVVLVFLLSPVGLLPTIAARSFRTAARGGGGLPRHTFAALVTLAAAAGPVAAGAAAVVPAHPMPGSLRPRLPESGSPMRASQRCDAGPYRATRRSSALWPVPRSSSCRSPFTWAPRDLPASPG